VRPTSAKPRPKDDLLVAESGTPPTPEMDFTLGGSPTPERQHDQWSATIALLEVELTCSLCGNMFENPHTVPSCGHAFCRECIIGTLEGPGISSSHCPTCRQPVWKNELMHNTKYGNLVSAVKALSRLQDSSSQQKLEQAASQTSDAELRRSPHVLRTSPAPSDLPWRSESDQQGDPSFIPGTLSCSSCIPAASPGAPLASLASPAPQPRPGGGAAVPKPDAVRAELEGKPWQAATEPGLQTPASAATGAMPRWRFTSTEIPTRPPVGCSIAPPAAPQSLGGSLRCATGHLSEAANPRRRPDGVYVKPEGPYACRAHPADTEGGRGEAEGRPLTTPVAPARTVGGRPYSLLHLHRSDPEAPICRAALPYLHPVTPSGPVSGALWSGGGDPAPGRLQPGPHAQGQAHQEQGDHSDHIEPSCSGASREMETAVRDTASDAAAAAVEHISDTDSSDLECVPDSQAASEQNSDRRENIPSPWLAPLPFTGPSEAQQQQCRFIRTTPSSNRPSHRGRRGQSKAGGGHTAQLQLYHVQHV